jgi:CRP/FNR family cyclic AMP-dependent transcriptional regulator
MARSNVEEPQNPLERLTIFAGLPQEVLERIRGRCRWRRYEPGEPIVGYLDASDDVFFITEGEARVTIYSLAGKAVSFRDLGPGDAFGEYPAIDGGPRSASVEARTGCHVASMPAAAFKELLQVEPAVSVVKVSRTVEVVN